MRLHARLRRLERSFPPLPASTVVRGLDAVVERLCDLVEAALPLLTEADAEAIEPAIAALEESRSGPYANWFRHLADGLCRLPIMPPSAVRDLLLAWLSPNADGGMVCRQCGLEYPRPRTPPMSEWKLLPDKRPLEGTPPWYDLPVLFPICPSCGADRHHADWPPLTRDQPLAWKELDGYAGEPQEAATCVSTRD